MQAFDALLDFANVAFRDLTDARELTELALAIAELDLVIGVDSAAIHLAGSLGRPVWVLLGSISEWYWPVAADRSPWYPTARIFRPRVPGDLDGLTESVRSAFAAWLRGTTARR